MREDVEPWAQPPPLSPPCPSIPSCGQRGLPALGPASVLLLCFFHVNLFIYPAPKRVSELPGGAVCGGGSLGEHWAGAARSPQLLFLLEEGMGRGTWPWPAVTSCPGSQVA